MDRAKRLLADPQSQVKLVAQQAGFENVNMFIREFKSFEGISPGVYKETLLKKESDANPRCGRYILRSGGWAAFGQIQKRSTPHDTLERTGLFPL